MPGTAPHPGDLVAWLKRLETRLRKLESSPRAAFTSINQGGLSVLDAATRVRAHLGVHDDGSYGFTHTRADGSVGLEARDDFVGIRDHGGAIVFSDDATSGQGIATPWFPMVPQPATPLTGLAAEAVVTATAPQVVYDLVPFKTHPKVHVQVLAYANTAAGTVDLYDLDNGAVLASVSVAPSGVFGYYDLGPVPLSGAFQQTRDLQIRATAGAGANVGVKVVFARGEQS